MTGMTTPEFEPFSGCPLKFQLVDPVSERLLEVVKHVCARIPLDDLRQIAIAFHAVYLEFNNLKASSINAARHAQVEAQGERLWVNEQAFTELSNSSAIWILAHELAHCFQWAVLAGEDRLR